MMIRLRRGGSVAGAGKTSRVEICNAVVDRARVRTGWTRSVPASPAAGAGTGAQPRRPTRCRCPHSRRTDSPGDAAWE